MKHVRAKKHLGQHFLKDQDIALQIVDSLTRHGDYQNLVEIGPGTGVLTDFLIAQAKYDAIFLDVDRDSIAYLKEKYPDNENNFILADFLNQQMEDYFGNQPFGVVGNFPYNISSQIFFRVLTYKNQIPEVVGMVQKEVGERIAAGPGSKTYGILSVLLQAYYDVEYLFSVPPHVFNPPPKVTSGVLRLRRNSVNKLDCDEKLFFQTVKQGFNNRRKTLRNALKPMGLPDELKELPILDKRAEQLGVDDFVELTKAISGGKH